MGSQLTEEQSLYATLCEVERGLFHVVYRMSGKGLGQHYLPRYEVGSCESDARLRIERRARECGYASIVWEAAFAGSSIQISTTIEDARLTH